jgi:hypothetical protein
MSYIWRDYIKRLKFDDHIVQIAQWILDVSLTPNTEVPSPPDSPHRWCIIEDCLLIVQKDMLIKRSADAKRDRKKILL